MLNLTPCPYRQVDGEGHILCQQIKTGDREVSPALCRACPVALINCSHLKATLDQQARLPITVRWGNGKTEIWDDPAPPLALQRAACSAKTIPILSPRDCSGCPLRQPLVMPSAIPLMPTPDGGRRTEVKRAPRAAPVPQPPAAITAPAAEARTNIVAQKIIQLQDWLTKQKHQSEEEEPAQVLPIAVGAHPSTSLRMNPQVAEERRVGWTD